MSTFFVFKIIYNEIMSKRIFNKEQIAILLGNKYIAKCSQKSISYKNEFKVLAVKQYAEGMTASQIFRKAGLDPDLVGECVPDDSLGRWRRKYINGGEIGLMTDERGSARGGVKGGPRTKGLTDAERIKRLEIEVAYLKAKNDFLVKLRAEQKR